MNDRNVLCSIVKNVQLEQVRLTSILRNPMSPKLRNTLNVHLAQFHSIETRAHCLASQRGWDIPELSIMREYLTVREINRKLRFRKTDAKIASILILSNTQTMVNHLTVTKMCTGESSGILSQRLLDGLNSNIHQLQQFL